MLFRRMYFPFLLRGLEPWCYVHLTIAWLQILSYISNFAKCVTSWPRDIRKCRTISLWVLTFNLTRPTTLSMKILQVAENSHPLRIHCCPYGLLLVVYAAESFSYPDNHTMQSPTNSSVASACFPGLQKYLEKSSCYQLNKFLSKVRTQKTTRKSNHFPRNPSTWMRMKQYHGQWIKQISLPSLKQQYVLQRNKLQGLEMLSRATIVMLSNYTGETTRCFPIWLERRSEHA